MTPAAVQQIEREIAQLDDLARNTKIAATRDAARIQIREKWLLIKPYKIGKWPIHAELETR